VDVFVPDGTNILVERGAKVKAGRTPIARWI
jgi:hypothetical protein